MTEEITLKSHQELENQLKLFFFDDKSPGSAFFLPAGTVLYNNLVNFMKAEYEKRGYQEVITPVLYDKSLWETSGHWQKYSENMFVIEKHKNHNAENTKQDDVSSYHFANKAMNCIAGDSVISLSNCTSSTMEKLNNDSTELLLGYDNIKKELVSTNKLHFIDSGEKECLELLFLDGRKLICTPEHKILTTDGWVEAKDLVVNKSYACCGITPPLVNEEINDEWELNFVTKTDKKQLKTFFNFNMKNNKEIKKSLAFARICGLLITDGTISKDSQNRYIGELYTGHEIDLKNILNDLKLICDDDYNPTSSVKNNSWRVPLPSKMARLLANLYGHGGRMDKDSKFPDFILDDNLPIDFLRQFLSGIFGGDGWTPVLAGNSFTEVYIALSKSQNKLTNLHDFLEQMRKLLIRAGVKNHSITGPYKNQKGLNYHYRIKIHSDSTCEFSKYIGFAYCCQKQQRLSIVDSYYSLKKIILNQHNKFKDEYIEKSQNKTNKEKRNIHDEIKIKFTQNEYIFNEKLSVPTKAYLEQSISNGYSLKHMGGKGFYSPTEYLEELDAEKFFSTKSYAVERGHDLPMFKLKLLQKKNVGMHKVYDISVDENIQSFVANGIVVHNCPGHCLMFKHMNLSYRDLPLRLADFGVLHRNEFHGALKGLTRVRKFSQDDAHIFCRMSQIEQEISNTIAFIKFVYGKFNMKFIAGLSTRPEQYLGTVELWDKVEGILKNVLDKNFEKYDINDGDGAFYGGKIDFKVLDALGREHQLATIQLDFNLPERFKLEFKSEEGYEQPVMIHRAIFGSIERFIGILLESGQGKIPLFVSPRQVAILTVNDNNDMVDYAFIVKDKLNKSGIKYVDVIDEKDTISKKILNTEVLHYNYIVVVGNKEIKNNTINVRGLGEMSHDDFINKLIKEIN